MMVVPYLGILHEFQLVHHSRLPKVASAAIGLHALAMFSCAKQAVAYFEDTAIYDMAQHFLMVWLHVARAKHTSPFLEAISRCPL